MKEDSMANEREVNDEDRTRPWFILLRQKFPQSSFGAIVLAYLVALAIAEIIVTFGDPLAGILLHMILMVFALFQSAQNWEKPDHRLLLALALAPLIRIVSLSLPLLAFPFVYWFLIVSLPLFAAAFVVMRLLDISWRDRGLHPRQWPLQLAIGSAGILLGYIEYIILRPEPLVEAFTWQQIWLPALILLVSTGYMEELVFRRIMQKPAIELLGVWSGVIYVAVIFAILHIGYQSFIDMVFVFGVGLFFGWAVLKTDSVVGVAIAHGLINIMLFLVMPFVMV